MIGARKHQYPQLVTHQLIDPLILVRVWIWKMRSEVNRVIKALWNKAFFSQPYVVAYQMTPEYLIV